MVGVLAGFVVVHLEGGQDDRLLQKVIAVRQDHVEHLVTILIGEELHQLLQGRVQVSYGLDSKVVPVFNRWGKSTKQIVYLQTAIRLIKLNIINFFKFPKTKKLDV